MAEKKNVKGKLGIPVSLTDPNEQPTEPEVQETTSETPKVNDRPRTRKKSVKKPTNKTITNETSQYEPTETQDETMVSTSPAEESISESVEQETTESKVDETLEDETIQPEASIKTNDFKQMMESFENEGEIYIPDNSSPIPPFEYGYESQMTAENLNMPLKDLFMKRKVRNSDVMMHFIPGSVRSRTEAFDLDPSYYYVSNDDPNHPEYVEPINELQVIWRTSAIIAQFATNQLYDAYKWVMYDKDSKWRNGIRQVSGKYRGIRSPQMSFESAKMSEKRAVDVVSAALNMGKDIDIFLPHSGFSIQMRPPTLSEFIECERKIYGDKMDAFRKTRGLLLSSDLTFVYQAVFDMMLACITKCSLGTIDKDVLRENILMPDIHVIAWALACAKFPNGMAISLPCFASPGTCNYVQYEVIDIRKMYFVLENKITDRQVELSSIVNRPHTTEEVNEYIDEFDYGDEQRCQLRSYDTDLKINIVFGIPTLGTMFNTAERLNLTLQNAANRAFLKPLTGDARINYLKSQQMALRALVYESFVMEVEVENEDGEVLTITTSDEILRILTNISGNPYLLSDFLNGCEKFINKATVAMIGIPNVPCPGCGKAHDVNHPNEAGHRLIPIDVLSFFSILCQQLTTSYLSKAEEQENEMRSHGETTSSSL